MIFPFPHGKKIGAPKNLSDLTKHRCVYCSAPATSRDHVPPKAWFAREVPQRIRVPSCSACNTGASKDDENFRVVLSLAGRDQTPTLRRLSRLARRTLEHSRGLRQSYLNRIVRVPGFDEQAVQLPSQLIDAQICRLTRALYWYHFNEVLLPSVPMKPYVPRSKGWNQVFNATRGTLQFHHVGWDQFSYGFARAEEAPQASIWIFQFYRCVNFAAITGAPETIIKVPVAELAEPPIRVDSVEQPVDDSTTGAAGANFPPR